MKSLCIFGTGGFAKEVYWLAMSLGERIEAFIDLKSGGECCGKRIEIDTFFNPYQHNAVVAIGSSILRKQVVEQIIINHGSNVFTSLISKRANLLDPNIIIGQGSVICDNCILTCDIELGPYSQLNLATTIGHDTKTKPFFTTAPGVHISGKVNIGETVYMGTNSSCIEGLSIYDNVIVGAGATITKDITESGTYIGTPAKKLIKST